MELPRRIREIKGWTRYQMARELKMSDAQYKNLEEINKSVATDRLVMLKVISGLSWEDFGELLEEEIKK